MSHPFGGGLPYDSRPDAGSYRSQPRDYLARKLGSSILAWWEPRDEYVTVDSSGNVSALAPIVGSASLVQTTAGNRPAWVNDGGPNNQPYINLQAVGRSLATASGVATAGPRGIYCVFAAPGGSTTRYVTSAQNVNAFGQASSAFAITATFLGPDVQTPVIVTPALDTEWHLGAIRALGTGALCEIDGEVTDASFTGSAQLAATGTVSIGSAGQSGGRCAFLIIVSDCTATIDAAIKAHVAARFGL